MIHRRLEEIGRAAFQRPQPQLPPIADRDHHDRNAGGMRLAAEARNEFVAHDPRHIVIGDDQAGAVGRQPVQGLLGIAESDNLDVLADRAGKLAVDGAICRPIIDDNN